MIANSAHRRSGRDLGVTAMALEAPLGVGTGWMERGHCLSYCSLLCCVLPFVLHKLLLLCAAALPSQRNPGLCELHKPSLPSLGYWVLCFSNWEIHQDNHFLQGKIFR